MDEIRKLRGWVRPRDMRDALVLLYVDHCSAAIDGKTELLPFDEWVQRTAERSRELRRKVRETAGV